MAALTRLATATTYSQSPRVWFAVSGATLQNVHAGLSGIFLLASTSAVRHFAWKASHAKKTSQLVMLLWKTRSELAIFFFEKEVRSQLVIRAEIAFELNQVSSGSRVCSVQRPLPFDSVMGLVVELNPLRAVPELTNLPQNLHQSVSIDVAHPIVIVHSIPLTGAPLDAVLGQRLVLVVSVTSYHILLSHCC